MKSAFSYTRDDWENFLSKDKIFSKQHAKSIIKNIYRYKLINPKSWKKDNFPQKLIDYIINKFSFFLPKILFITTSQVDSSIKFLLELEDKNNIECVIIPQNQRLTLCISTQIGCKQGCKFCQTGKVKFIRNLKAEEIVGQFLVTQLWLKNNTLGIQTNQSELINKITNIVFMGMGEPLENVENVIKAIKIFIDPYGIAIGLKHISISTSGYLLGLKKLLTVWPNIPIAISLNATEDNLRTELMPINKKWSIAKIIEIIKYINKVSTVPVLIQYVLIKRLNDRVEDAKKLCELLKGLNIKVNLIPYNIIYTSSFGETPQLQDILTFYKVIKSEGIQVTLRFSKGADINAACGQLYYKKFLDDINILK